MAFHGCGVMLSRRRPRLQCEAQVTTMSLRAEQVGSLLRPPELLAARSALAGGRIDAAQLRAREDAAIRDAVGRQRDVGMDVFADGEMRRASWLTGMAEAV